MKTQHWCNVGLLACSLAFAAGLPACMPDVGTDLVPELMEFDPTTGRVPEPIFLVQDPTNGKIDLGLAGVDVPEDCSALEPLKIAECEFNQYLESLDGFPTLTPAKTPSSVKVDMELAKENVKVIDVTLGVEAKDLVLGYDEEKGYLTIDTAKGWNVGSKYVVAVRGYEQGLTGSEGEPLVASAVFHLLRQTDSLTCGAKSPEEVTKSCKYYAVLEGQSGENTGKDLAQLEAIRQYYAMYGAFEAIEEAGIPRDETVVAWGFSIHTSPVVELDPTKGLAPVIAGESELRVGYQGILDPATVSSWSMANNTGTVFLLNLTKLGAASPDLVGGLPAFEVAIDGKELVLTSAKPLEPGDMYGVIMTDGVKDPQGKGLVPSPVTVLLRASGPLVDEANKTTVPSVTDAQATELEAGRATLAVLLDNKLFSQLTGLARPNLAFVYALTVPGKTPTPAGGN